MEMPFGKHRGAMVDDVPNGYLRWLASNIELFGDLKDAITEKLNGTHLDDNASFENLVFQMNQSSNNNTQGHKQVNEEVA